MRLLPLLLSVRHWNPRLPKASRAATAPFQRLWALLVQTTTRRSPASRSILAMTSSSTGEATTGPTRCPRPGGSANRCSQTLYLVASVLVSAWRTTGPPVAASTDRSRGSDLVEASVMTFAKYAKSAGSGLAAGLGHTQRARDTGTCVRLARSIIFARGLSRRRPPRRGLKPRPSANVLADVWTQWTWWFGWRTAGPKDAGSSIPELGILLGGDRREVAHPLWA